MTNDFSEFASENTDSNQSSPIRLFIEPLEDEVTPDFEEPTPKNTNALKSAENSQEKTSINTPEKSLVQPIDEDQNLPASGKPRIPKYFALGIVIALLTGLFFVGGYFFPISSVIKPADNPQESITSEEADAALEFAQRFSADFDQREKVAVLTYLDSNNNNQKDEGEPGKEGINVRLFTPGGDVAIASATSNWQGEAYLYGVKPGKYEVRFEHYSTDYNYNPSFHSAQLFQVSGKDFTTPKESQRVLPTESLPIEIVPDQTMTIAIQEYQPKNIVVGSYGDTVIFYDTDVQRQIGWVNSQETEAGAQIFWLINNYVYFLNAAGDVQKYNLNSYYIDTVLKNPGIMRRSGFEFAILSPGGNSLAYAINAGSGSPLRFASTNSNCPNPELQYNSQPLLMTTSSNPYSFFQLSWLNDEEFWFAAKSEVGGTDHLYFASCADNNRINLRQATIYSESNDYFYDVLGLDDTHALVRGGFVEPDQSSTTGAILRQVRGTGVVQLENGKPDTLYFLGSLKSGWTINESKTWIAAVSNDTTSFYKVEPLKNGEVKEVSMDGYFNPTTGVWSGDVFYILSSRDCDGMVCNTIQGYKPTDSGVEKVETLETINQTLHRLHGVIKN